jgi:hypothetical protein
VQLQQALISKQQEVAALQEAVGAANRIVAEHSTLREAGAWRWPRVCSR